MKDANALPLKPMETLIGYLVNRVDQVFRVPIFHPRVVKCTKSESSAMRVARTRLAGGSP